MTRRTGLSNAAAAARRLYGARYGGTSVKNVSFGSRVEFEGKILSENGSTLLFVTSGSSDEATAMMCAALRAAKPPRKAKR